MNNDQIQEVCSGLYVDCPDCINMIEDDQYTCTTCWCEGGDGKIPVSTLLHEYQLNQHKELISEVKDLKLDVFVGKQHKEMLGHCETALEERDEQLLKSIATIDQAVEIVMKGGSCSDTIAFEISNWAYDVNSQPEDV